MGQLSGHITSLEAFLVESNWPGVTLAELGAALDRAKRAAAERSVGANHIAHMFSTLIAAEETALSVFAADSATTVEETCRRAGLPCSHVVAVIVVTDQ